MATAFSLMPPGSNLTRSSYFGLRVEAILLEYMGRKYHSRVSKILKLQHTSVPARVHLRIAELWVNGKPGWGRVWRGSLWGKTPASSWGRSRMRSLGALIETSVWWETLEMWTCGTLCCRRKRLTLSILVGTSVPNVLNWKALNYEARVRCSLSLSCGSGGLWSWKCFPVRNSTLWLWTSPPPVHRCRPALWTQAFASYTLPSLTPDGIFKYLAWRLESLPTRSRIADALGFLFFFLNWLS